ncbi:MAG: hypothetical protein ACLQVI_27455 [Polyangiaceae bacterium]
MTYRRIAAFPFAWASLFLAVVLVLPAESREACFRVGSESSKALAAIGCFVAAYTFERGDYMRRAWRFNAWCYLLLLSRDITMTFVPAGSHVGGHLPIEAVEGTLALFANISSVLGTLLLARAWSIAGLEFPGSSIAKWSVIGVAALSAFGVSGTDLLVDGRAVLGGDLGSFHGVASDIGDVLCLCLLAPMLLTVAATSGGVLKWPWGLLTASLAFWLLYDAAATINHLFPGHETATRLGSQVFRVLACACECSAGLAQRRVVMAPSETEGE